MDRSVDVDFIPSFKYRDEIAMSVEAYETLYCSSAAFGIRKALQSQEGKEQLFAKVKDLEVLHEISMLASLLVKHMINRINVRH